MLDVLLFDDLSRQTVTLYDVENDFDWLDIVIDDECSKRVSVFDKRSFILKVYKFFGANFKSCWEVNLSQ